MEPLRLFDDGQALAASIGYNTVDLLAALEERTLYVKVLTQKLMELTSDPLVMISESEFVRAEQRDIGWNHQDDGSGVSLVLSAELDKSEQR